MSLPPTSQNTRPPRPKIKIKTWTLIVSVIALIILPLVIYTCNRQRELQKDELELAEFCYLHPNDVRCDSSYRRKTEQIRIDTVFLKGQSNPVTIETVENPPHFQTEEQHSDADDNPFSNSNETRISSGHVNPISNISTDKQIKDSGIIQVRLNCHSLEFAIIYLDGTPRGKVYPHKPTDAKTLFEISALKGQHLVEVYDPKLIFIEKYNIQVEKDVTAPLFIENVFPCGMGRTHIKFSNQNLLHYRYDIYLDGKYDTTVYVERREKMELDTLKDQWKENVEYLSKNIIGFHDFKIEFSIFGRYDSKGRWDKKKSPAWKLFEIASYRLTIKEGTNDTVEYDYIPHKKPV